MKLGHQRAAEEEACHAERDVRESLELGAEGEISPLGFKPEPVFPGFAF